MSDELLDEWSVNHTLPKEEVQLISVGATLRMIAFFFDLIVIIIISVFIAGLDSIISLILPSSSALLIHEILYYGSLLLYYPLFESSKLQASVGKFIVSIKVVNKKGERMTLLRALGRLGASIVATITFLGLWMIVFTDKRGMNDIISETYVVKNEKK